MSLHWTNKYTGKVVKNPLRVKNLVTLLSGCGGESIVIIKNNSEIIITNSKGKIELHMPFSESFLEKNNGELDGQSYEHFKS